MIPRTVQMAKAVSDLFSDEDLEKYGNIVLNGYLTVGMDGTSVRPAMKGWTTNYAEYYTQLPLNSYDVNPGDPTGFNYTVHSFTPTENVPRWALPPHRPVPSDLTSNPNGGIRCSWIFPVADTVSEPPIDNLNIGY